MPPTMMALVFVLALAGIAASTIAQIVKAIAGRRGSASELAHIRRELEQYAVALEDAQTSLANQSTQIAELQERVDFAERLLAQSRDRSGLRAGEPPR